MAAKPLIVGIGGTTRAGAVSERALDHALRAAKRLGADTLMFGGADLPIDPYDPAQPDRDERARTLVDGMRRADGIVLSTPSYHGGVSGLVKNAIDYAEDLRGDDRPYFDGRAVGCIVCADGAQAMGATLTSLRSIIHALRGWPTPYGATINATGRPFDEDGAIADDAVRQALDRVAEQVVDFARMRLNAG